VLTALWRRPAIAEAVLRHTVGLDVPGVEIFVWAVRSPEDADPAPDVPGVRYVEAPNVPLSDKWNAGMEALRDCGLDAVMVIGSDDFVSAGYVAAAVEALRRESGQRVAHPPRLVLPREIVFLDSETGRACAARPVRPGAGRVLPRASLDALGWRPWPDGLDRRLDGGMDRRLAACGVTGPEVVLPPDAGPVVDVKGPESMWPLDAMAKSARRELAADEVGALFDAHSPAARALFDSFHQPPPAVPSKPTKASKRRSSSGSSSGSARQRASAVEMIATARFEALHHEGVVREGERFRASPERAAHLARLHVARYA